MNRRDALMRMLGFAAAPSFIAQACAETRTISDRASVELRPLSLDRLVETKRYVCQRPFRAQGFRVEREEAGGKTVIHNYGHGGGGMTLSWGTADQSIALLDSVPAQAAVVGCGVIGLSTGLLLLERGCDVRILAAHIPPDTTSNLSAANFFPSQVSAYSALQGEYLDSVEAATRFSHRRYRTLLDDPSHGVTQMPQYFLSPEWNEEIEAGGPAYRRLRDLFPHSHLFGPGSHPFKTAYAFVETNLFIDPDIYLSRLLSDFRAGGGRVEVAHLNGPDELLGVEEPVVFNCSGLGARDLARDLSVEPLLGQHLVAAPQDGVRYAVTSTDGHYMMATGSRVVLGGGDTISTPEELIARQRALLPEIT